MCALGGDGTVRAVAQELVATGVALGLLPGGTGNLLARNLGLPVDSLAAAAAAAFSGQGGWLVVDPDERQRAGALRTGMDNVHCFTVMAGVGFDAQIMDDASESVKDRAGWAATHHSSARSTVTSFPRQAGCVSRCSRRALW